MVQTVLTAVMRQMVQTVLTDVRQRQRHSCDQTGAGCTDSCDQTDGADCTAVTDVMYTDRDRWCRLY